MLRISGGWRVIASACLVSVVAGCAGPCILSRVHRATDVAETGAIRTTDLVYEEAIRGCRETILKALKPYGVIQVAFWSVGALSNTYDRAPISTLVTAVYLRQGGSESRTGSVECRFNENGAVIRLL